jgi:hypothetical protein
LLTAEFCCNALGPLLALTAIRCGAQNSVAIGATADITGLEATGGSIENDPQRSSLHCSKLPRAIMADDARSQMPETSRTRDKSSMAPRFRDRCPSQNQMAMARFAPSSFILK